MADSSAKADLVLHEGVVLGHPGSDSVALGGGRILSHGRFAELKSLVGPRTHLIKLGGRALAPGFVDAHLHFLEAAAAASGLAIWRCRAIADLLADLRVGAGRTPPGNWLRAFGCDEALLADKRGPSRQELDGAVAKNPLRLRHQTLHASWLNSRAIMQLGLEAQGFRPPDGATIFRDATGKMTGLVVGMEPWLTRHLPIVTKAEIESRARIMSRELCAAGVTAFTDATVRNGPEEVEMFAKLVSAKAIVQRVALMIGAPHLDAAANCAEVARAAGLRIAGLKFMPGAAYDGSTAARRVRIALASGLDCAFHATEVEELEEALGAIELARRQIDTGRTAAICRIEHGGVIAPDHIARIAAVGAWVVTNPGFIYFRGAKYAGEPGLAPHLYRAASLRAAGIELAGASDAPVTPARPLTGVAAAISRATLDGAIVGAEERLNPADAFALFTRDAARLQRLEAGVIAPGMLADLMVLPRDPMNLGAAELHSISVDLTLIAGRVVYERGRPAVAYSDSADLHSA
ncbi:MAG TPA: amidohydrolase family protein [Candidatus Binataceae bacterium]|nr:amidohydrolase family protein [Candidatus Binataceae bacterium]